MADTKSIDDYFGDFVGFFQLDATDRRTLLRKAELAAIQKVDSECDIDECGVGIGSSSTAEAGTTEWFAKGAQVEVVREDDEEYDLTSTGCMQTKNLLPPFGQPAACTRQ